MNANIPFGIALPLHTHLLIGEASIDTAIVQRVSDAHYATRTIITSTHSMDLFAMFAHYHLQAPVQAEGRLAHFQVKGGPYEACELLC